jgi:alkanesulfonate monooxygenase SsuD/methylene tetrahydromethanopterin reductase-like flavin-dependent oxidoreductase (luciferase family)
MRFGTFHYNQGRAGVSERQAFDELLEQVELTERLGFDEAWFAEHHHSDYSLLPSPNLVIAALARRTTRLRLGNLVNVLPFHDPLRVAEEAAMLDVMTGGRLAVGVGRGIRRDEFAQYGFDREEAQARFDEAIAVILRAWTEPRFSHAGRFWTYRDVAPRPRPLQQPHPPLFYGAISPASADAIARRGWHLAQARAPLDDVAATVARYRAARAAAGLAPADGEVVLAREVYVAETDELAHAEAEPAMLRFWQLACENVLSTDPLTPADLPRLTRPYPYFRGGATVEQMEEWGVSIVGSPDTVAARLRGIAATIAPSSFVGVFSFGTLTHAQVTRSLELFATRVIPVLAPQGPRPDAADEWPGQLPRNTTGEVAV